MTIWQPELADRPGPIYQAIAQAISDDVASGKLMPGDRLPTQRSLAEEMGLAVTTVTRGYAEAERRGLLSGEVGRGTFVRENLLAAADGVGQQLQGTIDLTPNQLGPYAFADEIRDRVSALAARIPGGGVLDYQALAGTRRQREAGAALLNAHGAHCDSSQVMVTSGAQHAMAMVFATIADPGETVLTDELTYSGMKAVANMLRLRLHGLPQDQEGLRPDALEQAARDGVGRVLYCMPTLQNPTGVTMSEERRDEIATIAAAHDIAVVEDDSYAFLQPGMKPICSRGVEGFYVMGTAKSLAAGVRIGYLAAPTGMTDRLKAAVSATTHGTSHLMAEVVTEWIGDGTAERIMQWKRDEVRARQEMAQQVLGQFARGNPANSQQVWIQLPDPWSSADFVAQAEMRGVRISPASDFAVGRTAIPHAVRACLGPVADRAVLRDALATLAEILNEPPDPCVAVV